MVDTGEANSLDRVRFQQPLLGAVIGAALFYITSLGSMVWLQVRNTPEQQVLVTLAIVLVAGASVFLGRRWPRVGLVAGSLILTLVLLAWITSSAYPLIEAPWTDWRRVLSHGAGSTLVPVIGTVLICSSVARGPQNKSEQHGRAAIPSARLKSGTPN